MEETSDRWPPLPLGEWKDTYATLHRWMQIVGKTRLAFTPLVNHWWNVPLYVSPSGLTTSIMYDGDLGFEVEFDFLRHVLRIRTTAPATAEIALEPKSVAAFYKEYVAALASLGIELNIFPVPVEIEDVTPFDKDFAHASYDPVYANRFWRILFESEGVFNQFRSRFIGKSSPTHFFWGGFDLALTRFSGRKAPEYSSKVTNVPIWVMKEGYSHELISSGFWPGGGTVGEPVYYTYAYPEPAGFAGANVEPATARYDSNMHEFFLTYESVRTASSPDVVLLQFLQSTYEAGAINGKWDRAALERGPAETELSQAADARFHITDNPSLSRLEANVNGNLAFVEYRKRANRMYLTHMEVPPALAGKGIGSELAKQSLDYARANKMKVIPACPFVAAYIRSHPEYSDILYSLQTAD
jgi:predicted GNAT family acetyltransferase